MTGKRVVPLAALLYLLVSLVSTYPLAPNAGSRVILPPGASPAVPLLDMWTLSRNAGFWAGKNGYWDGNIFYPQKKTLAYSENLFSTSLLASPMIWATGNLVLAYNTILLLALAANGFFFFLFARRLWGDTLSALLGGILFEVSPFFMEEIDVLHLLTFCGVPLLFGFLLRFLESRKVADLLPGLGAYLLNAGACLYYGIMVLPFLGMVLAFHWRRWTRPAGTLLKFSAGWILALLLVFAFLSPYRETRREMGFQRDLKTMETFSARPGSFLSPPDHNRFYSWVLGTDRIDGRHLFPGLSLLVLAGAGLFWVRPKSAQRRGIPRETRKWFWTFLLLGGAGFLLSLGPSVEGFPGPYRLLAALVPGFDAIGSPFRFAVFGIFFTVVAAVPGIRFVLSRWAGNRQTAAAVLLGLVIFLESASFPFPTKELPGTLQTVPEVYRWFSLQKKKTVQFEFPTPENGTTESLAKDALYTYFSSFHGNRLVNGYSGFFPGLYRQLKEEFKGVPTETGLKMLEALGVNFILIHTSVATPEQLVPFSSSRDLELIQRFRDTGTFVYLVKFPHLQTLDALEGPVEVEMRESQKEGSQKVLVRLEFPIPEDQFYVYLPGGNLYRYHVSFRAASGPVLAEDRFELKNSRIFYWKQKAIVFPVKKPPVSGKYTLEVTDENSGKLIAEKVVTLN